MTDYSKLKVTDLKDLLSARSLPVSGKKEELIARLTESDAAQPPADDLGDLAPPEEEYDWDTPTTKTYLSYISGLNTSAAKPETKSAAVAAPAPSSAPSSAPKQAVEAPKPAAGTTAKSPPLPTPAPAPTVADTTDAYAALAAELEKRKRRAERFGIPLAESAKALERARKFGIQPTPAATDDTKKAARGRKFGNQVWTKNENAKNRETKKAGETKAPIPPTRKILEDPVEAEKAKKRAERFGGGNEAKKVKS